jgi:hypothetical protein
MSGTSEVAQEILTCVEDLRYVELSGWLFRLRAVFEWLKTGHVSCCCETGNEVFVSLKNCSTKRAYQSLYMDQSTEG